MKWGPLVRRIQQALTPDLAREPWRSRLLAGADPMTGHCYVATEALCHLSEGELKPCTGRVDGLPHWWAVDADGRVVDVTASQFDHPVDYAKGRRCGFLTKAPSKRAKCLMGRM